MHFKRIIALIGAVIYISAIGAAAAEESAQPVPAAGQTMQTTADGEQTETALGIDQPVTRASAIRVVASTHKVQVNGESVSPQAYNIDGYNYFKLRDVAYLLRGTASAFDVTWDSAKNAVNIVSGEDYTVIGGEMTVASVSTLRVQESTSKVLLDGSGISIKGYNINGNNYYKIVNGAYRARTYDPLLVRQMLSQLS